MFEAEPVAPAATPRAARYPEPPVAPSRRRPPSRCPRPEAACSLAPPAARSRPWPPSPRQPRRLEPPAAQQPPAPPPVPEVKPFDPFAEDAPEPSVEVVAHDVPRAPARSARTARARDHAARCAGGRDRPRESADEPPAPAPDPTGAPSRQPPLSRAAVATRAEVEPEHVEGIRDDGSSRVNVKPIETVSAMELLMQRGRGAGPPEPLAWARRPPLTSPAAVAGTPDNPLRVAVVGSGPAGFYATGHLLAAKDVTVVGRPVRPAAHAVRPGARRCGAGPPEDQVGHARLREDRRRGTASASSATWRWAATSATPSSRSATTR